MIQVKAAIAAVRNVRSLPADQYFQKHGAFIDLFDFLQYCFGFQVILILILFCCLYSKLQEFLNIHIICFPIRKEMWPTRGSICFYSLLTCTFGNLRSRVQSQRSLCAIEVVTF